MTEQTEHKPDPMGAILQLDGVMWELVMILKYGRNPNYEGRAVAKLRAALEALEGPAK
jgi:hypothetical protein